MENEPVVSNDTEPQVPSDQTSDSALSAAYDALFSDNIEEPVQVAPPVVEEPVVPEVTVEPPQELSHEESSRLGRKVAELSNKMVTRDDLDAILKKLENLQAPTSPQFAPVAPDPFTQAEQEEIMDITDV